MLQTVSPLILKLSLFLVTATATHLVMSFGQTLIHYKVAHHPMGGKIFRDHINFHHAHYSGAHLVSRTYLGDEGNTTPYFFIPVFLVGGCAYSSKIPKRQRSRARPRRIGGAKPLDRGFSRNNLGARCRTVCWQQTRRQ